MYAGYPGGNIVVTSIATSKELAKFSGKEALGDIVARPSPCQCAEQAGSRVSIAAERAVLPRNADTDRPSFRFDFVILLP